MDKESLLCATVSSKHLLTAQLQYNLVALTLIFRDSRPFVLIPKQVTCLSVIVHFIVSTWFLWPVLIIQLPEASQPVTAQSVLSFSPHMQVIPMPLVFYTGNYNQIDWFLCCFNFIWDLLSETNNYLHFHPSLYPQSFLGWSANTKARSQNQRKFRSCFYCCIKQLKTTMSSPLCKSLGSLRRENTLLHE